jgi:signal transduction histidine kinase
MVGVVSRLRRSSWTLPLAALAAVVVFIINEGAYRGAYRELLELAEHDNAGTQIQTLLRRLIDAETGTRGYLLTGGRSEYLEPYQHSVKDVGQVLQWLTVYYGPDAQASAILAELGKRSREKLSEAATSIQLHNDGRHDAWRELMLTDIGREKMESIRDLSNQLLALEASRMDSGRQALFSTLRLSRIGVNTMVAISLLALFLFLRQTQRYDALQRDAAAALQAERDRLEQEVINRTADLTDLAGHLETAREDERSNLARELHDELGALLTAAKLDAARLKRSLGVMAPEVEARLKHLNESINEGIGLKRRIIEDLRPSSLNNLGLVAALEIQAREFAKRMELKVNVDLQPVRLPDGGEITVYRLVQESLTNIAKYAKASEVWVSLHREDGRVHVSVRDNGSGFEMRPSRGSAHGLMGMRYRVENAGGVMQVQSTIGEGTLVQAWIPMLPDVPVETETTAPAPEQGIPAPQTEGT